MFWKTKEPWKPKRDTKKESWHVWFAWFPVDCGIHTVWLERVARRYDYYKMKYEYITLAAFKRNQQQAADFEANYHL